MNRDERSELDRERLLRAFGQTPSAFSAGIDDTLRRLQSEQEAKQVRRKIKFVPVLALILVLLAGMAVAAALYPRTAERFGALYGEAFRDRLEQGDAAQLDTSCTLGDVIYTVTDVIYENGVLFGTVVMEPREGANIVLIPEDTDVGDPAGYNIHAGEEAPADAKSYAEIAGEHGARIVLAKCVPDGYVLDGELLVGTIGYFDMVTTDGTIVSSFEVSGWNGGIDRAETYTLRMNPHNWEITPDGEWLRGQDDDTQNTWLRAEWDVIVSPVMAEKEEEEPLPVSAEGLQVMTPEGFSGTLPVYGITAANYLDVMRPELITSADIAKEEASDGGRSFTFVDDDLLSVSGESIFFYAYDGTEEIIYENEAGSAVVNTVAKDEVPEYLADLASWEYFEAEDGWGYAQAEAAADLSAVTLAQAKTKLEELTGRLDIRNAEMVYARAMDMESARALSDARNAMIEAGAWLNSNPYDLSGMTERDEGYVLVYKARIDGVPAEDEYMRIFAYVTVDGIRHLSLYAPFVLGDVTAEPDALISVEDALARAVQEAKKSWIPELADGLTNALCAELIYAVKDRNRLIPAWRFYVGNSKEGVFSVDISAVDGALLKAPWM